MQDEQNRENKRENISASCFLPSEYLDTITHFIGDLNFVGGWIDDFKTSVTVWQYMDEDIYKVVRVFPTSVAGVPAISVDLNNKTSKEVIRFLLMKMR